MNSDTSGSDVEQIEKHVTEQTVDLAKGILLTMALISLIGSAHFLEYSFISDHMIGIGLLATTCAFVAGFWIIDLKQRGA